ncbi:ExeM/NucH family extracellular endonuclease [Nocardioides conyzicola]|uniref:LTD domain-containing protein n=1 Tax=Nocardioides conyzicola TaxID=1651781 RepID=A0ABP8XU80_9ACTN
MLASRKRLTGAVALAVVASGLLLTPSAPAAANPGGTGLVISEVYGGGGNTGATYTNDFVELYNPTDAAIALTGMSLQYRAAANTGTPASSAITNLNTAGSVPAHDWFVVKLATGGANGVAVPDVDFAGNTSTNLSGTTGQVFLANSTTGIDPDGAGNTTITDAAVIDFVGFGSPTIKEGATAAPSPSNSTSIARTATGADTDVNGTDFKVANPMHPGAGTSPLTATAPGAKTGVVGTPITPFTLAATGGTTPYTWSATGLPPGITVAADGGVSGTPTTESSYTPEVTVTDSSTPTAGTDAKTFSYTIGAEPPPVTAIKDIQGTAASSPLVGDTVSTQGVVTAAYPTGGINGFYLQTPGADTPDASDAIFVYGGASGFGSYPAIGDSVDVTGTVAENFGLTELTSATWTAHGSSLGDVTPKTVVPGTDCPLPGSACDTTAALDTAREAAEGEAFQPTGSWTLTDVYDGGPAYTVGTNSSSNFGELGAAAESSKALIAPTELYDVQTQATEIANRKKWNDAHRIVIDDGSSTNYTTTTGSPFPWMTSSYVPRVGAAITFPAPTILINDFSQWRLLPSTQVVGQPSGTQPQLQQTRAANATPADVGGDLRLATFNVLNFFPTDGNEYVAAGGGNACTYFTDRAGAQVTTNSCGNPSTSSGNGPRGAANPANVARQRDKIVAAINTANADIVSLEELENSAKFGKSRDFAITQLVNALNAASTAGKWDFAPSPTGADLPALTDEDVIRTGFIYQPARVSLVGASKILVGSSAFANAREPLAQAFKKVGSSNSNAFVVIVNHFKSKGSGTDDGTGQGNANPDRIAQADALVTFANDFKTERGLSKVFLVGDFNAYSHEDPIDHLVSGGYTEVHSTTDPDEETYNFDGQIGSLDHVLANAAALPDVSGADVWPINGYESVYYEYSRYNYNATNLYDSGPFRSSDHSPEIVGISAASEPATRDIQILGTNDFHGRIQNDAASASAGAAVLAGAVKQLRAANPDTVFAAAGDLIGASTFESFIAKDKPTIDSLNEAGLEVSAAGNHEFDQGYNDLVNRVMAPYNADTNPYGGANWKYIAANLRLKSDNSHALAPTFTKNFGDVKVGFVGAVTEHLPELVSPGGISQLDVTDIVNEVNASANDLKADGADVIVLLVHEGAAGTDCATMDDDPTSDFGSIIAGVNDKVDAIVSGHTHLAYNCSFPVAGWAGRPVTERPVVSAGQYGMALNKLVFTVDTATGQVQAKTQALLPLKSCATSTSCTNYPADSATQTIVTNAVNNANVLGAQPLGKIGGAFYRAKLADGTTENRGGESTLGNLVAEVQRWNTRNPESGAAQIAFMNPGGLRADMVGDGTGAFPRTLTYKQAANVQPFANSLVNEKLTGAQIKTVLEQQWQPSGSSRPFLKLGISKGFTYTFNDALPQGSRITGMWLNGTKIVPATVYSVTVNSFLATGGDNFFELNNGAGKQDTGKTDLQGMVDYMAAFGADPDVVPVDSKQNGVGVTLPVSAPASYAPGDHVQLNVSSWSMSGPGDVKDSEVTVKIGDATIGTATLDNAPQSALPGFDTTGKAAVDVVLPAGLPDGTTTLRLVGATTGTEVPVDITVDDGVDDIQILATNDFHGRIQNDATSASAGAAVLAGAVKQLRAANPETVFAAAGDLIGASTFESFIAKDKPTIDSLNEAGLEVSAAGNHEFDQGYDDLVNRVMAPYNADTNPYGGANWKYIAANLRLKSDNSHALAPTFTKNFGDVKVGFVGAVTEHLPELVSPGGISQLDVTDVVTEVNASANDLKADGADVIVLLVHEGAAGTDCATMDDDPTSDFGSIIAGVNDKVDAIVSGHTHLAYNCSFPVAGWSDRPVKERPVVSAGQYGYNLNKLVFSVDRATGQVQAKTQALLPLKSGTTGSTFNYPVDAATKTIVDNAVANANVLGAQPLGKIGGAFNRAKLADGTTENRGGESTLGNLVAEVQRWNTRNPESGAAQIAFMNPGGLRADMVGDGTGAFPRTLTYKQAANVQPFANTLVNEKLTGAQIKTVLEQQWQPDGASRPFLKLGISKGFTYTYDSTLPKGSRITGMWLNGEKIAPATVYSVTVNSFLSTGGDNFLELNNGTNKQDTGKTDLQGMVDYMAALGDETPVPVDFSQRAVGASFPGDAPASYQPGDEVAFSLSSLSMTGPGDKVDPEVTVRLGGEPLDSFEVTTTRQTALPGFDEVGTAQVVVTLPPGLSAGTKTLYVRGGETGTEVPVEIVVSTTREISAGDDQSITWGDSTSIPVAVTGNDGVATGTVRLFDDETQIGDPVTLDDTGHASVPVPAKSLEPGEHTLRVEYDGNYPSGSDQVKLTVAKATTTVSAGDVTLTYGDPATVTVTLGDPTATGTVTVRNGETVLGSAPASEGVATVTLPAGSLEPGVTTLTARYAGDAHFEADTDAFTATVAKVAPSVSAGNVSLVYGKAGTVTVNVGPSGATGTVQLFEGAKKVGAATAVSAGVAKVTLPARSLKPGSHTLTAVYSGDDHVASGSNAFTVSVAKAASSTKASASPATAKVKKTVVTLKISVTGPTGVVGTGKVKVKIPGQGTKTVTLKSGKATLKLAKFTSTGTKTIRVDYAGDDFLKSSSDTVKVKVKK